MVRIESKATELDRPWEEMVQAVIQKYPNPHSKSARVSDIISRHVNSHGHVITERYSGNKFPVPSIINTTFYKFTGIRFPELAFSYEYSVLDRENKKLTQYSKNTTMGTMLNFVEVIEYRPDENGKTSMMRQKWNVQTMINSWIDGWFEGQFLNICKNNAKDGINGIKWVAEHLGDGDLGAEKLAEFREQLKIYVEDVSHVIDDVEMKVGEISEKVVEVFTETADNVEETAGEITKKVAELYNETADNVEDVVEETTKRLRHYSEPAASRRR